MRPLARVSALGHVMALALVVILAIPLLALWASSSASDVVAGVAHPSFAPALWLSLRTSAVSVALIVAMGTPLSWWLASSRSRLVPVVEVVVELPIVMPAAVVGVALLQAFGRQGILGPALARVGLSLPFTDKAVIVAQLVVAAPFFVQAAANAFRQVDEDTVLVARTLGATPRQAFWRVVVPTALPGVLVGASLAWARALGEFGATLLFAGSMRGSTQTMPLAIFVALESDVRLAVVLALVLAALGAVVVVALRGLPALVRAARP